MSTASKEILRAGIIPPTWSNGNACYQPEMVDFFSRPRHLLPHRRHRRGPGRARHLLCARGQCPHALRRLLHAGEPRGDAAALPRALRAASHRAGRAIPRSCWRRCARSHRAAAGPIRRSPADARPFNSAYYEHSFLADKLGVELVEGARTSRQGRRRLHAHDRGPEARRRDLSPHRRRFPRPQGLPPGFSARRPRADGRLQGRQRHAGQRGRHRHRRRQGVYSYMPEIVRSISARSRS
jgi:hypothetical protein